MYFSDFKIYLCAAAASLICLPVSAGHLGSIGPTYEVAEPDMLDWIEARVRAKVESGEAERYQRERADEIKRKLANPEPLKTVSKALQDRTFYYDPTFVVEEHVRDDKGAVMVPAGTTVNPLDRVGLSKPLVFFDARDPRQVAFAKKFMDSKLGAVLPVLVGGSYLDLMSRWKVPVYFDQQASLIRRFGIQHVPAIVQQEGRRLRIDELAL